MKGAGEHKILQGTHVFLKWTGTRKYRGGLKKSRRGRPGGTSTGSVVEGCLKVEKYLFGPLLSTVDFYKNQKKSRSIIAGIEFKN